VNWSTKSRVPEPHPISTGRKLILCYGNPLRGDDGLASRIAEELEPRLDSTRVELICRFQLTPELAESISRASEVLFVDASAEGRAGEMEWRSMSPTEYKPDHSAAPSFTHQFSPEALLELCRVLFGTLPPATVVTVRGESFELGQGLSEDVKLQIPLLLDKILAWARE
jgi:hydrogenase maturation protease